MKSKLIFHRQETPYSCVPACLRIVLSGFDLDISEAELRNLCDCTPFGTEALNKNRGAEKTQLGVSSTLEGRLRLVAIKVK